MNSKCQLHIGYKQYVTQSADLDSIEAKINQIYEDAEDFELDIIHDDLEDAHISFMFDGCEKGYASTYIELRNTYFRMDRPANIVMSIIRKDLGRVQSLSGK